MSAYPRMVERFDGWCDWVSPEMTGYRWACCDCGLVHDLEFRVAADGVWFRARRNKRSTAAKRRRRPDKT
jgi:hypothetical protein